MFDTISQLANGIELFFSSLSFYSVVCNATTLSGQTKSLNHFQLQASSNQGLRRGFDTHSLV